MPAQRTAAPSPLRLPPHNVEAELAVLSACVLKPEKIDLVAGVVRAEHFYHGPHRLLFKALLELRTEGIAIDIVTLGNRLREQGDLPAIGGPAYLAKVIDGSPAVVHVDEHAQIVRDTARRRAVIAVMQKRAAEGYGDVSSEWEAETSRAVADAAELDTRGRNPIVRAWQPMQMDLLLSKPAPRRWLLQHPTYKGRECAPGRGDGLIPLDKAGVLSSRGGTGKTYVMIQLAVSIATGLPWLGHFHVGSHAVGKRVLLGLAEENYEDYHNRIYPICEALGLDEEQQHKVCRLVQPLRLAGEHVSLLRRSSDGLDLTETEAYYALRAQLRNTGVLHDPLCPRARGGLGECVPACVQGWALVVLDPLVRWAGPDVETDNDAATHFIETIESLLDVPGRPTLLLNHHSSKKSRADGEEDDARGVGGITDGLRWHATLTPRKGGGLIFQQKKTNVSMQWDEKLELVRGRGGIVRVRTADEELEAEHQLDERSEARAARKEEGFEREVSRLANELVKALKASKAEHSSREELYGLIRGTQGTKVAAVTRLLAQGRLVKADRKSPFKVVEVRQNSPATEVQLGLSG
jgi:hypothetical protein